MLRMLRVRTESGSVYDVDVERRRIRRVHGRHGPTDTQPQDGIWRHFDNLDGPEPGQPMVVVWTTEAAARSTATNLGFRTTVVVEVRQVEEPDEVALSDGVVTDGTAPGPEVAGPISSEEH